MSKDGSTWELISAHENDESLLEPGSTNTWHLLAPQDEKQGWRHVRILQVIFKVGRVMKITVAERTDLVLRAADWPQWHKQNVPIAVRL